MVFESRVSWTKLNFGRGLNTVSAEFAGFEDHRLRFHCRDGLVPEHHDVLGEKQIIQGFALIGQGYKQGKWRFTLVAGLDLGAGSEIAWLALLTGWLAPDPSEKTLTIDPSSGYHGGQS